MSFCPIHNEHYFCSYVCPVCETEEVRANHQKFLGYPASKKTPFPSCIPMQICNPPPLALYSPTLEALERVRLVHQRNLLFAELELKKPVPDLSVFRFHVRLCNAAFEEFQSL